MSEFEPTDVSADVPAETRASGTAERAPGGLRWKRVLRRAGIGIGATAITLMVLGVLVYEFGGMSGSAIPGVEAQYAQLVASGQAQPIQTRFVIPIPGCQCHSKDPTLTAQHSRRRMSECAKCHDTSPAHLEPGAL